MRLEIAGFFFCFPPDGRFGDFSKSQMGRKPHFVIFCYQMKDCRHISDGCRIGSQEGRGETDAAMDGFGAEGGAAADRRGDAGQGPAGGRLALGHTAASAGDCFPHRDRRGALPGGDGGPGDLSRRADADDDAGADARIRCAGPDAGRTADPADVLYRRTHAAKRHGLSSGTRGAARGGAVSALFCRRAAGAHRPYAYERGLYPLGRQSL